MKKYYCIYCKIFLLDNPANRRNHEKGEKHKQRMKAVIDDARATSGTAAPKASSSFYGDHGNNRIPGEDHVFPRTKREFHALSPLYTDSMPSFSRIHSMPTPEMATKKAPKTSISFSFKSKTETSPASVPPAFPSCVAQNDHAAVANHQAETICKDDKDIVPCKDPSSSPNASNLSDDQCPPKRQAMASSNHIYLKGTTNPLTQKQIFWAKPPMASEKTRKNERITMASDEEED